LRGPKREKPRQLEYFARDGQKIYELKRGFDFKKAPQSIDI
jgi:hypothetical protein